MGWHTPSPFTGPAVRELAYEESLPAQITEGARQRIRAGVLEIHGRWFNTYRGSTMDAREHEDRVLREAYNLFAGILLEDLSDDGEVDQILEILVPTLVSDTAIDLGWSGFLLGARHNFDGPHSPHERVGAFWVRPGQIDGLKRRLEGCIALWYSRALQASPASPPQSMPRRPPNDDRKQRLEEFLRAHPGISKAKVFERAGVDRSSGFRWQRGEIKETSAMALRIEKVLDLE